MPGTDEQYDIVLKVRAEGDAELKRLSDALEKVQRESAQTQRAMTSMSDNMQNMANIAKVAAATFAAAFAAQTIINGFTAITDAIGNTLAAMDELSDASQRTGVPVEELSALQYAAGQAGVETEALEKSLTKLNKGMAQAKDGTGAAKEELARYGVTAGDTATKAISKIADAFSHMKDAQEKSRAAQDLFGKSGADLIPLLNEGAAGLKEMTDRAARLGLVITQEAADAVNQMNDQLEDMQKYLQGVANQIVVGLAPALAKIIDHFSGATVEAEKFQKVGESIGRMLMNMAAFAIQAGGELNQFGQVVAGFAKFAYYNSAGQVGQALVEITAAFEKADAAAAKAKANVAAFWKDMNGPGKPPRPDDDDDDDKDGGASKKIKANKAKADAIKETAETLREAEQIRAEALEEEQRAIDALLGAYEKAGNEINKVVNKSAEAIQKVTLPTIKATKELTDVQREMANAVGDFAASAITDMGNIEDAAKDLIATLAKLLIQEGLKKLFTSAIPGIDIKFAKGGVVQGGVQTFAGGGVVDRPTLFPMAGGAGLMGEAGPEAIMPLQRNAQGVLGVAAPPVNVSVINNAGAAVSVQDRGNGDIDIIIERTKAALAQDVRNGGNGFSRSLERVYGVNRSAGAFR